MAIVKDLTQKVIEQKKEIERKTLTIKELAAVLGVGEDKARQLTHTKGFPVVVLGKRRLIIASRLDSWLDENIGRVFE